ncbi:MAG: hypothetical protein M3450_05465 [Actinomycetota bacterium]|nr:hypothetical protein [Actinomycetota bacterium]
MGMHPGYRLGLALVAAALILLVMIAGAGPATAHPLGNFTLNRYARVEVSAGVVRVYYVIDLAEVPSYQVRKLVDADPDGYLDREMAAVVGGLELELDGRAVELEVVRQELSRPRGEGGMRRVRIDAVLEASLPPTGPDEVIEARFADGNQPERMGWREIVVMAAGDATLVESSAPSTDVADELRNYPDALLRDPIDLRAATFIFKPGSRPVPAAGIGGIDATGLRGDRLTNLLDRRDVAPLVVAGMLGVAALVGGGHALAPGHGKTVMAAYLVGTKGRPVDALLLGFIVSAMHTTSVLVLGVALLQVDRTFALDRLYPALTVASGVGVLVVGGWLAAARLRAFRSEGRRTGRRGGRHRHGHGHGDHSHALPADVAPLSRGGLALLATAGGIVPSPSAVMVVVSAFSVGRIGLGLGLVLAFSIGLAATLTAVGLAFVLGGRALGHQPSARLTRLFPVLGAMALVPLGFVLVLQGARGLAV